MKSRPGGILAVFQYLDQLIDAMEKAKKRGDFDGHEVFSPTSYHEIEEAGDFGESPVKWFTLVGALTGTLAGFALALYTDFDWPIVVGGKSPGIASLPAYVVIGFELTILLGGIATILGMLVMCRLPNPTQRILDKRFTDDRFGIFVPNASLDGEQARILKECGAEELREVQAS
jgi:molybdopterin-containing oxidoreductase family membrane subunit